MCHMTTTRVRLVTYVDPATADLVRETADALDQTTSSLVADMVSYGIPMLEVLRDMAISIKTAPDQARARVLAMAEALRPMADEALKGLSDLERMSVEEPPTSNTGVRT